MSEIEQGQAQGVPAAPLSDRRRRGEKLGVVVSAKMQKTVVVAVGRVTHHPLYQKAIRRTSTFMAHDELGAKAGDTVRSSIATALAPQALARAGDRQARESGRSRVCGAASGRVATEVHHDSDANTILTSRQLGVRAGSRASCRSAGRRGSTRGLATSSRPT